MNIRYFGPRALAWLRAQPRNGANVPIDPDWMGQRRGSRDEDGASISRPTAPFDWARENEAFGGGRPEPTANRSEVILFREEVCTAAGPSLTITAYSSPGRAATLPADDPSVGFAIKIGENRGANALVLTDGTVDGVIRALLRAAILCDGAMQRDERPRRFAASEQQTA